MKRFNSDAAGSEPVQFGHTIFWRSVLICAPFVFPVFALQYARTPYGGIRLFDAYPNFWLFGLMALIGLCGLAVAMLTKPRRSALLVILATVVLVPVSVMAYHEMGESNSAFGAAGGEYTEIDATDSRDAPYEVAGVINAKRSGPWMALAVIAMSILTTVGIYCSWAFPDIRYWKWYGAIPLTMLTLVPVSAAALLALASGAGDWG